MRDYLDDLVGVTYSEYAYWAILGLAALVAILIVYAIVRRMVSGTYVAGGRNRTPRLAVTDAAAVDSHRRLVLVRRDDVEHLILIGGAADIVIEQNIRLAGRTAPRAEPQERAALPLPPVREPLAREPLPREPFVREPLPREPARPQISLPPLQAPALAPVQRAPEPPRVPPVVHAPAAPPVQAAKPALAPQSPFRAAGSIFARKPAPEPEAAKPAAAKAAGAGALASKPAEFDFDDELMADLSAQLKMDDAASKLSAADDDMAQLVAELNRKA